jgi:CDP-glucose 4,6-dehydratase
LEGLVNFYKDKNVLVTGHTGFKGTWLSSFLHELGAKVHGLSLPLQNSNYLGLHACDIFSSTKYADIRNLGEISTYIR